MLRYKTATTPGLVALYDIWPGNGAGQFLQPRSPHGHLTCKNCWDAGSGDLTGSLHVTEIRWKPLQPLTSAAAASPESFDIVVQIIQAVPKYCSQNECRNNGQS